jgi:hypothetical protein
MSDHMTWAETRMRLRRDRERLERLFEEHGLPMPRRLRLHPSYQSVLLHRLSHHFFHNGHRFLARLFWHFNLLLTGADIAPLSEIGPGLVIVHPISTLIFGRVGRTAPSGDMAGSAADAPIGTMGQALAYRSSVAMSFSAPVPSCSDQSSSGTTVKSAPAAS